MLSPSRKTLASHTGTSFRRLDLGVGHSTRADLVSHLPARETQAARVGRSPLYDDHCDRFDYSYLQQVEREILKSMETAL
jgi:hypothetical protein